MAYQELTEYLLSCKENEKTFTYQELNLLVKGKMPQSAWKHPHQHFANSEKNVYASSWMSAGFIAKKNREGDAVTFYRQSMPCSEVSTIQKKNKVKVPKEKINCIILNKSFTGEWLNKEDNNVAHEIINFFKADDGKIYIYNTPYGANVSNSEELNIKYLYLTTAKPNGVYFLEYCVEIEKSLHNVSIGRAEQSDSRDRNIVLKKIKEGCKQIEANLGYSHKSVTYGGVPVIELFDDSIDVLPFTYLARKIYKAKEPIAVDEKNGALDYNFARNFGYVLESEEKNTYRYLLDNSPLKSPKKWKAIALPTFKILDDKDSNNKEILDSLDNNSFIDLIDNFKTEECYTKILYKLMDSKRDFINELIYSVNGSKLNDKFVPEDEYVVNDGRIDILAKSKKHLLIFENKIDSSITIDKHNVSQLKRYYDWAKTDNEVKTLKKIYVVAAPDYRLAAVKAEVEHLRFSEGFDEYKVIGYSVLYSIFNKMLKKNSFNEFRYKKYLKDINSLLLRMSLERKMLYTAKISKRILSLKK